MKITRVVLTKEKLAALPQQERTLFLLLGHAANEITVLKKLIMMTRKEDVASDILDHVEAGQAIIFIRLLLGKAFEAWLLFAKRVRGDHAIRDKFIPSLSCEGQAAIKALDKIFGKNSSIADVRNRLAFHYADEHDLTEVYFNSLEANEPWEFYMGLSPENSFYFASELVMSAMAAHFANKSGPTLSSEAALKQLFEVTIEVTRNITFLLNDLIAAIASTFLSTDIPSPEMTDEEIPEGPKLSEFSLPYFFADEQKQKI